MAQGERAELRPQGAWKWKEGREVTHLVLPEGKALREVRQVGRSP